MEDEVQVLVEDFVDALSSSGGAAEALGVLHSFADVLQRAPGHILDQLGPVYDQALLQAAGHRQTEEAWTALAHLGAALHALTDGHGPAAQRLQAVWAEALGGVLHGKGINIADVHEHMIRMTAIKDWAGEAVAGAISLHSRDDFMGQADAALPLMRSAAAFSILHPECMQGKAGDDLLALATSDLQGQAAIQRAFQAALEVVQAAPTDAGSDRAEEASRAWQFLTLFKQGPPPLVDAWWGVYASAVIQLLHEAEQHGSLASGLRLHPEFQAVAAALCHADSAHMLVHYLLECPAYAGGKDAAKRALQAAEVLLQGQPAALLAGCAELLAPEANATLAIRQEALHVMSRAAERYVSQHSDDADAAKAGLWRGHTLQVVLFALSRDPSVRIRREATKLLGFMNLGGEGCQQLLQAVCMRCRDKDVSVRHEAYSLLQRFPSQALRDGLTLAQWRCALDLGLAPGAGGADHGKAGQAGKHAAAIHTAATKLLHDYLMESGSGDGWVARLGLVLGGNLGGDNNCRCSGALQAAYMGALQEVLPPEVVLEAFANAQ